MLKKIAYLYYFFDLICFHSALNMIIYFYYFIRHDEETMIELLSWWGKKSTAMTKIIINHRIKDVLSLYVFNIIFLFLEKQHICSCTQLYHSYYSSGYVSYNFLFLC